MISYKLEAFILSQQAADRLPDNLRHLHRCRLDGLLVLVPVTRQLCKEVGETFGERQAFHDPYEDTLFTRLHPALSQIAAEVSLVSPVLYLEVDVASGIGDRTVIVWNKGHAAFGPSEGGASVTEALRVFGELEGLSLERIAELGIWRHRFTEDWVQPIDGDGKD